MYNVSASGLLKVIQSHMYVSNMYIFFSNYFHDRLLSDIDYRSMCYYSRILVVYFML